MNPWRVVFFTLLLAALPRPAAAYIGPGAGFALVSSFFVLVIAAALAVFSILTLPLRTAWLFFKRRAIRGKMRARRVIVLGFDGLDPLLCRTFMAEGRLPHLQRLAERGAFKELATTTPSISPVAWSTFATGVNPGKHNIFDFFTRNPRTYQAELSSARIRQPRGKGKKKSRGKTTVTLLRKSTAFWKILGEHKIFGTILRVPITFPPEKFYGACLSAMCAPDLRGTQGSFTLFTTAPPAAGDKGEIVRLDLEDNAFNTEIPGPALEPGAPPLTLPLRGELDPEGGLILTIDGHRHHLRPGRYTPWLSLVFKAGRKKVHGIGRFLLTALTPDLRLYLTPINIDPEHPSLPISHPFYYSICLAKLHGPFSTLGLAEDTWALNEGVIDEAAFLKQAYDIWEERERVFVDNLAKTRDGVLTMVFDTTDRIQHMFFRYLDAGHPANEGRDTTVHRTAIAEVYERADTLVGTVLEQISDKDVLFVVSDHGFAPFKWGINLNTWLWREGYLVFKDGEEPGAEWFSGVDWPRTRAFAFGLAGIFINTKGRERHGCVAVGGERDALLAELKEKLEALTDEAQGIHPIRRAIISDRALKGPYVRQAPDIIAGYERGYRVSWNSAIGKVTDAVIEPNRRPWSGDHCLAPELVPGVLFSNHPVTDDDPALMDLAPTILDLFGVGRQRFHDGKVLDCGPRAKTKSTSSTEATP